MLIAGSIREMTLLDFEDTAEPAQTVISRACGALGGKMARWYAASIRVEGQPRLRVGS